MAGQVLSPVVIDAAEEIALKPLFVSDTSSAARWQRVVWLRSFAEVSRAPHLLRMVCGGCLDVLEMPLSHVDSYVFQDMVDHSRRLSMRR